MVCLTGSCTRSFRNGHDIKPIYLCICSFSSKSVDLMSDFSHSCKDAGESSGLPIGDHPLESPFTSMAGSPGICGQSSPIAITRPSAPMVAPTCSPMASPSPAWAMLAGATPPQLSCSPVAGISPATHISGMPTPPTGFLSVGRRVLDFSDMLVLNNMSGRAILDLQLRFPVIVDPRTGSSQVFCCCLPYTFDLTVTGNAVAFLKDVFDGSHVLEAVPAVPNSPLPPPRCDESPIPSPISRIPPDMPVTYFDVVVPRMNPYSFFWFSIGLSRHSFSTPFPTFQKVAADYSFKR